MKMIFILFLLLGFTILFRSKSKVKRLLIYNKLNKNENNQEKKDSKKDINEQDKNISHFIIIPFFLKKIIYLKSLIVVSNLIIISLLVTLDIILVSFLNLITCGLIVLTLTIYIPKVVIKNVVTKRTESVLRSLPFFIDITAACVQSGMTIDNALSYAAKKFKLINSDLSLIINKMTKRAELHGLESAIKEFHQCSSATEIRMFCNTLQYSIIFGSSIYEQLNKLSQDMREMQLLVTEEKISKLSAKITFPLFIFILIPFIVLVISPSILEILTYVQKNQ